MLRGHCDVQHVHMGSAEAVWPSMCAVAVLIWLMFAAAVACGSSGVIIIIGDQVAVIQHGSSGLVTLQDYVNGLQDHSVVIWVQSVACPQVVGCHRGWLPCQVGQHCSPSEVQQGLW